MINKIIDFSVNNKFLVFALVAAACIYGVRSFKLTGPTLPAKRKPWPDLYESNMPARITTL